MITPGVKATTNVMFIKTGRALLWSLLTFTVVITHVVYTCVPQYVYLDIYISV